jgi:hypothetical protein
MSKAHTGGNGGAGQTSRPSPVARRRSSVVGREPTPVARRQSSIENPSQVAGRWSGVVSLQNAELRVESLNRLFEHRAMCGGDSPDEVSLRTREGQFQTMPAGQAELFLWCQRPPGSRTSRRFFLLRFDVLRLPPACHAPILTSTRGTPAPEPQSYNSDTCRDLR